MAHIRQKFKEGNLDGRSKKKYLSKIVFTYILGYPVSIGHMEAVNLISSTKYSEKQIGYLAITLLMNEGSELVRLVVNSVRKDLAAMNEVDNCLALHAVANIGGREMAESLAEDVHRLLISPHVPRLVGVTTDGAQNVPLVCQEEGRPHAAPAVPQIPRGHPCRRVGPPYCLHHGRLEPRASTRCDVSQLTVLSGRRAGGHLPRDDACAG